MKHDQTEFIKHSFITKHICEEQIHTTALL